MRRSLFLFALLPCLPVHAFGAEAPKGIDVVGLGADGQEVKGQKWAVLVGVNDYATLQDLTYSVADAHGLFEALTSPAVGFPADNIRLLVDDAKAQTDLPFKSAIYSALTDWLALAEPNDLVLVFFSGHGKDYGDRSFLMPQDALEKNPELTGLSLNTVREQLELCKARRKILILDMCHSGGKGGDEMSAATDKQIDDSAGMVTISSCKLREKSYEWPEVGHSAFIYHLLEALKQPAVADADKDGYLSVNELYTKVHQDVRRWAARYGGKEQTPKLAQEVEGQIVVARAPRGAPVVVEDLKTTATLRVTSTPSGAEVYIGGALQGRTPCEVTIDLGAQEQASLEVIVQQTGYRSKGGRVTVRRGQAAPWNVELERLPTDPVPPGPPVTPPPSRPADYEFVPIPAGDGVAAFELGKYEVTVGQFRKFVEATGYKTTPEKEGYSYGSTGTSWEKVQGLTWRNGSSLGEQAQDDHPVVHVSQEDARAFCKWIGARLPTDEEWEHAARGGLAGKQYVWGDEFPPPKGAGNFADAAAKRKYTEWTIIEGYDDGFADTAPVGSFKPNGYGLCDMAGNVFEWIEDRDNGCRGGSFLGSSSSLLRVVLRLDFNLPSGSPVGFRAARTL
ncbi:MAG: hypothetical protein COZ06_27820 [Armatimonadetes bacterium CG_4_10_14_3_um_filter_66_18]|nr:MAG: hypothetical protein COZ06_27820 [Armatimonadetes bacterium CG_4_10_14_3_um_filter_66_18]